MARAYRRGKNKGARDKAIQNVGFYQNQMQAIYDKKNKQIAELSKHILDLQKDKGNLTDRVRELEQQIEKMKCCANCKHSRTEYEHCRTNKHEKWEIKEK
jgi:peptidoglycan hydrolase CwlO-like protein